MLTNANEKVKAELNDIASRLIIKNLGDLMRSLGKDTTGTHTAIIESCMEYVSTQEQLLSSIAQAIGTTGLQVVVPVLPTIMYVGYMMGSRDTHDHGIRSLIKDAFTESEFFKRLDNELGKV